MSSSSFSPHAGQDALSMTEERAVELVTACIRHTWFKMGLAAEPPPDLSKVSLLELLTANHLIARKNRAGETCRVMCDDRLVAAIYVAEHYDPSSEAIVVLPPRGPRAGRALSVVPWNHVVKNPGLDDDKEE